MNSQRDGIHIRTERLTLREFAPADEPAVHAYASDPVVTRFMVWGPNTIDDTRSFIANAIATSKAQPRNNFDLAVICSETQALIGGAALQVLDNEPHNGEIGYILHRDHWSKGYGTEVAKALLQLAFANVGLHRVMATCDPENRASARVLQKAGMHVERRIAGHLLVRGSWRDSLVFGRSPDIANA